MKILPLSCIWQLATKDIGTQVTIAALGIDIKNNIHNENLKWIELRDHARFALPLKKPKSIDLMISRESAESFPIGKPVLIVANVLGMTNQEAKGAGLRSKDSRAVKIYLEFCNGGIDAMNVIDAQMPRPETA
jgi:hypothetical protein